MQRGTGGKSRIGAGARTGFLAVLVLAILGFASLTALAAPGANSDRNSGYSGVATAYNADPSTGPIEPNPELETNATVSTFASGYTALEYPSSTGVGNLSAELDPAIANPIAVTPQNIIAPGILQSDKAGGIFWNATTAVAFNSASTGWDVGYSNLLGGTETGPTVGTTNGEPSVAFTFNFSSHQTTPYFLPQFQVHDNNWPSANLQFDYITFGVTVTGPSISTTTITPSVENITAAGAASVQSDWGTLAASGLGTRLGTVSGATYSASVAAGSATMYYSVPLSALTSTTENLNQTVAAGLAFGVEFNGKASTNTGLYTMTVTQLAFTSAAMSLGKTTWGVGAKATSPTVGLFFGAANLTAWAPSFTYTSIVGGGYTAAVAQFATNLPDPADVSTSEVAVSIANATTNGQPYVEQVTYQFTFGFPTASGISYGATKLIDDIAVAPAQYSIVTFGGTAYTTAYQAYVQGVRNVVASAVTPTTATVWIGVIDFTGPQWDSIATNPGLFSSSGLEYWWFVAIGAIIAIVGGSSAWVTRNERALRVRRGTTGVLFMRPPGGRKLARNERAEMEIRHGIMVTLGLVTVGAGGIAIWSVYDGADVAGAAGSFVAGFLLLVVLAGVGFVVYEIYHHVDKRRNRA
jgi:hypothetical protein